MRKRLLAVLAAVVMVLGMASIAGADPGPNGSNDHGLCTAYFNGQKKGHDKHGSPGPFAALEEASRTYAEQDGRDNDKDGDIDEEGEGEDISAAEAVFNYCDDNTTIGGNPEHGRYTCDRDPEADSDPDCEDNPDPGNGNGNGGGNG